jgi:hypothetical protein
MKIQLSQMRNIYLFAGDEEAFDTFAKREVRGVVTEI